jgi:hypothetical protein
MDQHEQLHQTLRAAAQMLDSAASQVVDVKLVPTKQHLQLIGEALALFLEQFASQEPSVFHRDIAVLEATRYKSRHEK